MEPSKTLKAAMKALARGDEAIFEMMCNSIIKFHPDSPEADEARNLLREPPQIHPSETMETPDSADVPPPRHSSSIEAGSIAFVLSQVVLTIVAVYAFVLSGDLNIFKLFFGLVFWVIGMGWLALKKDESSGGSESIGSAVAHLAGLTVVFFLVSNATSCSPESGSYSTYDDSDYAVDACISSIRSRAESACEINARDTACGILHMDNINGEYSCRETWMVLSEEQRAAKCKQAVGKIVRTALDEGRC